MGPQMFKPEGTTFMRHWHMLRDYELIQLLLIRRALPWRYPINYVCTENTAWIEIFKLAALRAYCIYSRQPASVPKQMYKQMYVTIKAGA